jgi:cytochrome c oxidase subunit 2
MRRSIVKLLIFLSVIFLFSGCIDLNFFFEPEVHVITVTVDSFRFGYDPDTIKVHMDETIVIKLNGESLNDSVDVDLTTHSFTIDEFDVDLRIERNETGKTVFTPTKRGRFTFYCSVFCGEGHDDMKGLLIVE